MLYNLLTLVFLFIVQKSKIRCSVLKIELFKDMYLFFLDMGESKVFNDSPSPMSETLFFISSRENISES